MTREEAIQRLKANRDAMYFPETREALDMAIEALSQPIVAKCYEIDNDRVYCSPEMADKIYRALHEDTNMQNMHKGEWIGYNADKEDWLRTDGTPIFLVCDKCHGIVINNGSAHWNFCPNCGAKMYKGGDDE